MTGRAGGGINPGTSLPGRLAWLGRGDVYWTLAGAMVALTLAAAASRVTAPDIGIFLYAAARILDGDRLYRDFVEINPPLIVWLNVPAVLLARWTGLADAAAFRLLAAALLGGCILLCERSLRLLVSDRATARCFLLLLWLVLFPLVWIDYGQREHLLLGIMLPYVVLAAAREANRYPSTPERLLIGGLNGIGIALKPHFALLWITIEAYLWRRAAQRRIGPEALATAIVVALYGVVVIGATSYVPVVAVLGPAYATFMNASPDHALVLNPAAPLVLFSLAAWVALRRSPAGAVPCGLLASAIAAAYAAGVLQHKGFRYHYYPAFALAMVLVGWLSFTGGPQPRGSARLYARITPLLAATIILVVCGNAAYEAMGLNVQHRREVRGLAELVETVQSRGQGRPVGVLSYSVNGAFPLLNELGAVSALRLPSLWPLAAAYWDSLRTGGALRYRVVREMPPAELYLWDAVREDLTRSPPGVLLVLSAGQDVPANGLRRLNYVAYFARDPDLRRLFGEYQLVDVSGEYLVYEHLTAGATRAGPPPSLAPLPRLAPRLGLGDFTLQMVDSSVRAGVLVFVLLWIGAAVWSGLRAPRMHRPPFTASGGQSPSA
jgi:hypothetical protein